MKKRFFIFMLLVLLAALLPLAASAETSGSCGDNLTWTLTDDGLLTISGQGEMTNCDTNVLPEWHCDISITSVIIEDGVTSIGDNAFSDCSSLANVTIPDSVTSIGNTAFYGCISLAGITIPDRVTSIGDYAFTLCDSLTNIIIPNSVTNIGNHAFCYCRSLISITLPDNVTSIDDYAFCDCSSLENVTIPNSVTNIGEGAFDGCSSLTSVTIPNSVTSIGFRAFDGCSNLTSITIPNAVTSIGTYAFDGCSNLTSITIPDNVTSIGRSAFPNVKLYARINGDGAKALGKMNYSFWSDEYPGCELKYLYNNNEMTGLSVISADKGISSAILPNGVISIGNSAFRDCISLADITIPDSLTSIGNHAFNGCSSLTSIMIPDSVTSIGAYAFYDCYNLTKILIGGINTSFGDDILWRIITPPTIYCYEFSDADYWAEDNGYTRVYLDTLNWDAERTVTLFPETARIATGSTRQFAANVFPNDDHPVVTWSSSNPAVATVDASGFVTAVGKGEAVITASVGSAAIGGAVIGGAVVGGSDSATVTVYTPVESFELPVEIWVVAKSTYTVPVTLQPADADAVFTWQSADESCATVDENGVVTGRKPGDTTVTATVDNGISRACTVHVCYPVSAINFSQPTLTLELNKIAQLTANVTMRTQTCVNHLVTFTSSDETVITVDEKGLVTAQGIGTATVTAAAESGAYAICTVTVRQLSSRLTLPAGLTAIESEALTGLNAVDVIVIPEGVTSIAPDAFTGTGAVLAVTPGSAAEQFCIDQGLDYMDVANLD